MSEFPTNPEQLPSGAARNAAFHEHFLERLWSAGGKTTNASTGDPAFKPFDPISTIVGRMVLDTSMKRYRNERGDKVVLDTVLPFFKDMGVKREDAPLSIKNIVPGLGVTNLYSALLPKLAEDAKAKHPDKKPVFLMTSPTYGLFSAHPEFSDLEVMTVPVRPENNWHLQPEDLDKAISEINASGKQVAVFYNVNPHNPTGAVLGANEVEELSKVLKKHDVFVIDDMAYKGIEFAGHNATPFASVEGMFDKTITLLGISKPFCAASFRSAVACASEENVGYIQDVIANTIQSVPVASQYPLVAAYSMDSDDVERRNDYLRRNIDGYEFRKKMAIALIDGIDAVNVTEAEADKMQQAAEKILGRPEAKRMLAEGIDGVTVANKPIESGYFLLLDFDKCKGKYCGNVQINNSSTLAPVMVDYGKTLFVPSAFMLSSEEHPMLARATFALTPDRIARMARGIQEGINQLTDEPDKSKSFRLDKSNGVER